MFFEEDRIAAFREMICADTVEEREAALDKILPYQQGGMVAALHDTAQVLSSEYTDNGIQLDAVLDETLFGRLRQYVIEEV